MLLKAILFCDDSIIDIVLESDLVMESQRWKAVVADRE